MKIFGKYNVDNILLVDIFYDILTIGFIKNDKLVFYNEHRVMLSYNDVNFLSKNYIKIDYPRSERVIFINSKNLKEKYIEKSSYGHISIVNENNEGYMLLKNELVELLNRMENDSSIKLYILSLFSDSSDFDDIKEKLELSENEKLFLKMKGV